MIDCPRELHEEQRLLSAGRPGPRVDQEQGGGGQEGEGQKQGQGKVLDYTLNRVYTFDWFVNTFNRVVNSFHRFLNIFLGLMLNTFNT